MTQADPRSFGTPRRDASAHAPDTSPDPRDRAIRRLARQARHYPDLRIGTVDTAGLDDRDAGLARAIEDTAIRRWVTLVWIIERVGGRVFAELEPKMRGLLLAGSAQVLFLDRVPDHAAIDESVEWAKRNIRPGAGGMVNAILRKIAGIRGERRDAWTGLPDELALENGGALALTEPVLPEGERERLSIATGAPVSLLARWEGPGVRELALHTLVRPPTVLNVAHARTPIAGDDFAPHERAGHAVFAGAHGSLGRLLDRRDDVWVQDAASSGAIESVRELTPGVIVDVCAGKGTKTRQARAAFPGARIVATDVNPERYAVLKGVFAGDGRVEVVPHDRVRESMIGSADLVMLDVPCSNSGVLARRPEAKHRVDDALVERLAGIQRQIIADAVALMSESGAILYSTCSLEREENEDQAAWARTWHTLRPERERRETPAGVPGDPPSRYRDGAYSVVLRR